MKGVTILFLCLALASLACLQTSSAISGQQLAISTQPFAVGDQPAVNTLEPTLTKVVTAAAVSTCARVVAIKALHLRREASETSMHLMYMFNGEVVRVLDRSDAKWWFIERKGVDGYARSVYLQESECE